MAIINRLADLLIERKSDILAANQKDLRLGHKNGRTLNMQEYLSFTLCKPKDFSIISLIQSSQDGSLYILRGHRL